MNILVNRNPVELIIKKLHPKIRRRKHSSYSFGHGHVWFDYETKKVLYKYATGGPVIAYENGDFRPCRPTSLYINSNLYDKLNSYLPNLDKYIKEWFERTYNLKIERVVNFIP